LRAAVPVTVDQILDFARTLERTDFVVVGGRRKLRVGSMVYASFYENEGLMGFAYPKEERSALVASGPDTFFLPRDSDLRYNWVLVSLDAIELDEARELVLDAWGMVVPRFLLRRRLADFKIPGDER
jgi:hypothetical protein